MGGKESESICHNVLSHISTLKQNWRKAMWVEVSKIFYEFPRNVRFGGEFKFQLYKCIPTNHITYFNIKVLTYIYIICKNVAIINLGMFVLVVSIFYSQRYLVKGFF